MFRKRVLLIIGVVLILAVSVSAWLLRRPGCSITYRLNPDMACRVLDVKNDGTHLVEYFNADTNELRLYVQQSGKDLQIEHPFRKVKEFKEVLNHNEVKFNPSDSQTLLVNGEVFPITPIGSG